MKTNELFLQVAQMAGWQNISKWDSDIRDNTYVGFKENPDRIQPSLFIPRYDQDLNAIVELFDKFNIFFNLSNLTKTPLGVLNGLESRYSASSNFPFYIAFWGNTPAIAMCKLFVAIIEQKKSDGLLK